MHSANPEFGQRLFSKNVPATGGVFCALVGVVLIALSALIYIEPTRIKHRTHSLSQARPYAEASAGGLGLLCLVVGVRHLRRVACTRQFFETGVTTRRGRRRWTLAYADAHTVTYTVHMVGGRPQRLLVITGPGGRPEIRLSGSGTDEEAGIESATDTQVENVSSLAVRAVAARLVEQVDRGEVLKWTDRLWIDPAGLRLDDATRGRFVPWPAIDGVKDGSQSGKIEVFAFGEQDPVASAPTTGVNALPAFHAFMVLLDRGQAAAKAA